VLLIPCYHEAARHSWFLIATIKMQGWKHKMYFFDSLGIKYGRKITQGIQDALISIKLVSESGKCTPVDMKKTN
jgi:hypothetical protein